MTNEEAINLFCFSDWIQCLKMPKADLERIIEAMSIVGKICINQSAYIDREQVEKGWRGEWIEYEHPHIICCSRCDYGTGPKEKTKFCPSCGAPMTDEAMEIRLKELEALYEST